MYSFSERNIAAYSAGCNLLQKGKGEYFSTAPNSSTIGTAKINKSFYLYFAM